MDKESIAVVFPGQGSQRLGMGRDFFDNITISREVYEEASDTLGWDVAAMCFGENEHLNLTEYTQPCIATTEIAMLRGLRECYGFSPTFFGGHSLGEFTALIAAEVLSLSEALRIVQARGRLMQKAVPIGIGAMSAVISKGIDPDAVRKVLADLPIDVANVNSANQVVISGEAKSMPPSESHLMNSISAISQDQTLRFVSLNVSAPFHSRFMKPIEEPFEEVLRNTGKTLNSQKAVKVTSNYTGGFHTDLSEEIVGCLVSQLSNTVQWKNNMDKLASVADTIYEVGPNRPLKDFFRTIEITCLSITSLSSAEKIFEKK